MTAPAACRLLLGTVTGERFAWVRCFELSDYIKVKVLRTETSKLQGKVLDLTNAAFEITH